VTVTLLPLPDANTTSVPTQTKAHEIFVAESTVTGGDGQPIKTQFGDFQTAKRASCSRCFKIFFRTGKQRVCPECKPPFRSCKECGAVLTTGGSTENPYTEIKYIRICNTCAEKTLVPAFLKSLDAFERRLDSLRTSSDAFKLELQSLTSVLRRIANKVEREIA